MNEIPAPELAVARAVARRLGRPVFAVCDTPDGARRLSDELPDDAATLAYVVDARGTLRMGPAGRRPASEPEPQSRAAVTADTARLAAAVRLLRRLLERAALLEAVPIVTARDWARVERLIPDEEREALHPAVVVGLPGALVAEAIRGAVAREAERLRGGGGEEPPARR